MPPVRDSMLKRFLHDRGAPLVRPLVGLGLLLGALYGARVCLTVLAVFMVLALATRAAGTVEWWRAERMADRMWERDEYEASLRPCLSKCMCGCGAPFDDLPANACEKPCFCGCGRACVIHENHRGECGA